MPIVRVLLLKQARLGRNWSLECPLGGPAPRWGKAPGASSEWCPTIGVRRPSVLDVAEKGVPNLPDLLPESGCRLVTEVPGAPVSPVASVW